MRAVFDTNVLVSALIKTGKPRQLFSLAAKGRFKLLLSKRLLEEFLETADAPKIRKYADQGTIDDFLRIIDNTAEMIKVKSKFKVVKADPDDDYVLRTAFDGKAEYVVSGDSHLLVLGEFRGIRIVTIDEFLTLLE
jgi:putative PIN family toxin of toxin-antitoxin system